ncbi:MAG: copper chaperone PCu(A)C [Rhodospirillaceae bacterium]|nr:copper chaperone PCu(A)C [Rhodospirillaceae bacterium]
MFKRILLIGFALVLAASAASARDAKLSKLSIVEPWARASMGQGKNAVAYLTIINHGETADRLLAVTTPVAKKAGLHTHLMEGGMMKMRPLAAIEIKSRASTVLKPGGHHIMLMGLKAPLKEGGTFPMTFTFEQVGSVEAEVHIAAVSAMRAGEMKMAGSMRQGKDHDAEPHAHTKPHDPPAAAADQKKMKMDSGGHMGGKPHDHKSGMQQPGKVACTAPVRLDDAAERKPGGALYKGPLPKEATAQRQPSHGGARVASGMPSMSAKSMKEMQGAHQMHKGQRSGELIMAPNQLHHLEVLYSSECGYQLFFYNAFTEPIRAGRFRAVVLVLPEEGDDFFEVLRILTPSADGSHLSTRISGGSDGPKPRGIFETELYIKFPKTIQPVRFEVIVGTEVRWK